MVTKRKQQAANHKLAVHFRFGKGKNEKTLPDLIDMETRVQDGWM